MLLGPGTKLGTYESRAPLGVLLETSLAGELAFVERAKRLIRAQLQRAAHDCGAALRPLFAASRPLTSLPV